MNKQLDFIGLEILFANTLFTQKMTEVKVCCHIRIVGLFFRFVLQ